MIGVVCEPKASGWFAWFYFVTYTVFAAFVLLSIFLGVIQIAMDQEDGKLENTKQQLKEIRQLQREMESAHGKGKTKALINFLEEAFTLLDPDGDGSLKLSMLVRSCAVNEAEEREVRKLFERSDLNSDGEISLKEFCTFAFKGTSGMRTNTIPQLGGLEAGQQGRQEKRSAGNSIRTAAEPRARAGQRPSGARFSGGQGGASLQWSHGAAHELSAHSFEISEVDGGMADQPSSKTAQQPQARGGKKRNGADKGSPFRMGDWLLGANPPSPPVPLPEIPTPAPTPMNAADEGAQTSNAERSQYHHRLHAAPGAAAQPLSSAPPPQGSLS
jgi:hypothetical protein